MPDEGGGTGDGEEADLPTPPPPSPGRRASPEEVHQVAHGQANQVDRLDDDKTAKRVAKNEAKLVSQTIRQRDWYGTSLLGLLVGQIVLANVAFFLYACANDWDVPTAALATYFSATLGQVISVAFVIVKHLFPPDDDLRT